MSVKIRNSMGESTHVLSPDKKQELLSQLKYVNLRPILEEAGLERHQFKSILNGRVPRDYEVYEKFLLVAERVKHHYESKKILLKKINSL